MRKRKWKLYTGDMRDVCLEEFADDKFDSIVTDPPYGLSFMGKEWDSFNRKRDYPTTSVHRNTGVLPGYGRGGNTEDRIKYKIGSNHALEVEAYTWFMECLRVLKPGGHLLAFGGTRTFHRLACAIEDAGFELRDCIMWVYGSGFPKSHNLKGNWDGWGTALKPAWEPIIVARNPFKGPVVANVLKHGTGAININGCRIGKSKNIPSSTHAVSHPRCHGKWPERRLADSGFNPNVGRWPANLIHDGSEEILGMFPSAKGQRGNLIGHKTDRQSPNGYYGKFKPAVNSIMRIENNDSASRFFYCAKASKRERGETNNHPTVKPLALMRYLVRLVTPASGRVLDPFSGSGSTVLSACMEGMRGYGIDLEHDYTEIAEHRLRKWEDGV